MIISDIDAIKRGFRDQLGFIPNGGNEDSPTFDNVPDGEYLITLRDKAMMVRIKDDKIFIDDAKQS